MAMFTHQIHIPSALAELTKTLEAKLPGTEFRFVGGCIRDLILGRTPKDWDIITNALPHQLETLDLQKVGAGFPVYLLQHEEFGQIEIACCRTERKISVGHNGFEVKVCQSFAEDALRRDLTVNACSWHHSTPDTIYSYSKFTEEDFNTKTLRAMSPAFSEDPLRVFRVARFAAQLASDQYRWIIDPETYKLMMALRQEVIYLPPDRVKLEFEGAMYKSDQKYRNVFFDVLDQVGATTYWFNELHARPVFVVCGGRGKKDLLYLSLAGSMLNGHNLFKSFCTKLHLSLNSELETLKLLKTVVEELFFYPNDIITAEEILILCKRVARGKIQLDDYFTVLRDINAQASNSRFDAILHNLYLIAVAVNGLKFTNADTPKTILETKIECITELSELLLNHRFKTVE